MIATLRGEITQIEENAIVVETGNFGLRVFIPSPLRSRLHAGDATLLYTHLVVREDGWFLYGFDSAADRDLFVLLLGADGVGPRTAMAVMSGSSIEILQRAVYGENPDLLGHIPGVGRKTAQKILIHLKDRLKPVDALHAVAALSDADAEVLAALTTLGYSVIEAQTAIQSISKDAPNDVESRLRLALQYFTGS